MKQQKYKHSTKLDFTITLPKLKLASLCHQKPICLDIWMY